MPDHTARLTDDLRGLLDWASVDSPDTAQLAARLVERGVTWTPLADPTARREAEGHPLQPLVQTDGALPRFKPNEIVRFLLDAGPFDMNQLAFMEFSNEDREQFAQLIGYSLRGFGELSYVSSETWQRAEAMAALSTATGAAPSGETRTDWTNTGAPFCPRCGYPDPLDAPENGSPLASRPGVEGAEAEQLNLADDLDEVVRGFPNRERLEVHRGLVELAVRFLRAGAPTPRGTETMRVLAWLGYWRDKMPPAAVSALQDVLSVPPAEREGG